ncbi:hypothetical protein HYH03_007612 [Edaphochlamys debaryana]|uniref:LisH domain-containing protein n=1 Tax=Edaphochlamys debaryana TaxID=47281 RepID=A0A835Y304_9CHLO|nr:hypothetical protein HYH03_007612 [Edaphochlamys debaryana]|eukprot:KAG2494257.1 hypothetical protein HYH03_007612 [Edaphochlamys debaryana]
MVEPADEDAGLDQADLKKKLVGQLQATGAVGQVKSQLRAQLLSQLQKGQIVQLGPPPGDRPGLKRHALNSMIADYMRTVQYNYSLSVFKEESGIEPRPLLTEEEVMDILKIDRDTSFFQSYMKSKAHAGPESSVLLNLVSAISEAAAAKGKESFTQTIGGDRYHMEMRLKQLEDEYQAKLRDARLSPNAGLEERLAIYRQEIEEQAAAEVARQVERIREMEVAAARLDEAAKARRAMEAERLELDRMHSERLGKLRQREEEMMDKLRRQQRDVENVAYEHRQRILREEERLRNWKTEVTQQVDGRQEQLKQLERSLELRERAVGAREAAAEKRIAEATEAAAEAGVQARADAEREYMDLKNTLTHQRMELEMERNRIMELRSEATAELAGARAKEDRLRNLEAARAEAEARAAAHAADAEVCRLQAEKLLVELNQAREELGRRLAQAADGADAMLENAAGAMNMLNAEAVASRSAAHQIREVMAQLQAAQDDAAAANANVAQLQQERALLQAALQASGAEVDGLHVQLSRVEQLMDEAVAARGDALSSVEEVQFRLLQTEREAADLRAALHRAKEELAGLRIQAVVRRPPSRGPETSPARRSITLSPIRTRPAPGAAAGAISALSLGLALGGGPGGHLHAGHGQHWQSGGGSSGMHGGGTPTLSQMEFPIAAAPRDATTERMERLRRQEDIVAGQEDNFRRRMASLQEVRDRSVAILATRPSPGLSQVSQPHQHQHSFSPPPPPPPAVLSAADAPYMTYVAHSTSPTHHTSSGHHHGHGHHHAHHHHDAAEAQAYEQQLLHSYQQQQQVQRMQHEMAAMFHQQQELQQQQHQQRPPPPPQGGPPQPFHMQQRTQSQSQQQFFDSGLLPPQQQQQQQFRAGTPQPMELPPQPMAPQQQQQHMQQQQQQPLMPQPGLQQLDASARSSTMGIEISYGGTLGQGAQPGGGATQAAAQQQPPAPMPDPGSAAPRPDGRSSGGGAYSGGESTSGGGGYETSAMGGSSGYGPSGGGFSSSGGGYGLPGAASGGGGVRAASPPPPAPAPAAPPPGLVMVDSAKAPAPAQMPPGLTMASSFSRGPPQPIAPPPGLVMASSLRQARTSSPDEEEDEEEEEEEPAPPPKPTIPGLVMVSGFGSSAARPAPARPVSPPLESVKSASPPEATDVQGAMAAKMRMLQEQRERMLAAQSQPSFRRLQSKRSFSSSRRSFASDAPTSPGADPSALRVEDSQSEVIAKEARDTVAPELSTAMSRRNLSQSMRRKSVEGGGPSRTTSMRRNTAGGGDLGRGTSFLRTETSGFSTGLEAPDHSTLGGRSMRSMGHGATLDEVPSSLEGYELPGLNDEEEEDEVEAPDDEDNLGGFAAEFSAGSVF